MGQQSAMMSGGPNVATGQTAGVGGGPGMLSPQQQPPGTPNMMNSPEMFFELTQTGKETEGGFDYIVSNLRVRGINVEVDTTTNTDVGSSVRE